MVGALRGIEGCLRPPSSEGSRVQPAPALIVATCIETNCVALRPSNYGEDYPRGVCGAKSHKVTQRDDAMELHWLLEQ